MDINIEVSGNVKTVKFEGGLTIEHAVAIWRVLSEPFKGKEERVISVEKAVAVDASCLQLFCCAHRTALKKKKSLVLDPKQPAAFKEVLRDGGFFRKTGCHLNTHGYCFWVEGANE